MKLSIFFFNWIVSLYLITTPSYPFKLYPTSYATAFKPRFASSIYEVGIGSLDPLYIDFIQINHGGLKLDMHNIQIIGLKNTIIKSFNIDKNSRLLRLTLLIDYTLKSQYNAAGCIFSLPVFGNGDFSKTNTNVEMDMVMPFEIIKDGYGRDIIDLKGYQYSFIVKRAGSILLTNLYNGNKLTSDSLHALINQNWKLWSAEYEKFIYDKLNDKIFNAFDILMHKIKVAIVLLNNLTLILKPGYGLPHAPSQLVCGVRDTACLIVEIHDMFTALVGGNEQLNTKKLDTMFLDFLHINQNDYKVDFRNIYVSGLKDLVTEDVSIDLDSKIFRILFNTNLTFRSQYVVNGTLLSLPIEGKGNFLMKLNNSLIDLIMPFEIIKDAHGNDIMVLKSFNYTYDVRDSAQFYFENLYYGNKTASNTLHKVVQQNWKWLTIEFGKSALDLINMKIFNSILIYCLKAKFIILWDTLMDGIPKLGIERLDKMFLGNMSTSNLGLNYNVTNVELEGLRNVTVESFRFNMRLKLIEVLFRTTLINRSDYEVNGAVFSNLVYGSGKTSTVRKNIRFNALIFFDITKIDGKDILDLKAYFYGFDVRDRVVYEYSGLYNGDKKKSDNMHAFLNENWILITQNFAKNMLDTAADKVYNAVKTYLRHHPLEEIFIM
ncbi:unnamed protein product, partial [Brenthis ino]